ncbi:PREDICTED: interferon-inducible GTPase 5-like [Thamnophis sirtalis]|uniref:Interferon-inducible GTPase 5-like n=1 Tax=Thamnophis sirtalis TaxID=35019 RepID=A0A6I9YFP3_9SAUR|nr:PREDICTED: interferon-inducible GTPase 5-like [Thamnophis sirtalis]
MGNNVTKANVSAEFEDLKRDLNQGSVPEVADKYKKCLNEMHDLPLNIAVTGDSGAGKSSFVNAIRGVTDDDDEAAEVGVVETTMQPKGYPHPKFPNMKIWDLPGIGTPQFKAAEYLKQVNFETYDVFIIVTSDRFTENAALLAKEIGRTTKKFYFIRSKIDLSIEGEKRKKNFNKEKTLETIRNYCQGCLQSPGEPPARVFLISSWKVQEYDFPLLQETIAAELPEHQKDILTLAVHIFSENELMKKKEAMKSYIKKVAWVSFTCGIVPIPGLSMACDVGILVNALRKFCRVFGLDDRSLRFLARQTGKEYEELKSAIKKTPLANTINRDLVLSFLSKSSVWATVSLVELGLDFIPAIGSVFGGVSSYAVTYNFLNSFLDNAVEDARNIQAKFLK